MAKLIGADWVVYQDLNDLVGLGFRVQGVYGGLRGLGGFRGGLGGSGGLEGLGV